VLRAENASPRVCGMFYKATVQAVLLFGSEAWSLFLSSSAMKSLEGFHLQAVWRMALINKSHRKLDGTWKYPSLEDVLKEVGLFTIAHYAEVWRQTIASCIINQSIFSCRRTRQHASPLHAMIGQACTPDW